MAYQIVELIKRILSGKSVKPGELELLKQRGLSCGKNLRNHSEYTFDALFPWLITVGDNVCISSNVKILAHDTSTEYVNGYTKIGTVTIGNNVYIGYGAIIMCNVRVGDNAIIGAGSVVTTFVPSGTVYAGNPARFICTIEEYKTKHMAELKNAPVYDGPVAKWWELPIEEKESMRDLLKDTFGYMK